MPTEREKKHIIEDKFHSDGTETIQFRSGTPFNTQKRIAKRFQEEGKEVTLYSDGRLEVRPTAMQRMESQ